MTFYSLPPRPPLIPLLHPPVDETEGATTVWVRCKFARVCGFEVVEVPRMAPDELRIICGDECLRVVNLGEEPHA